MGVASDGGGDGGFGGGKLPGNVNFEEGNAHMFTCISDVVRWCNNDHTSHDFSDSSDSSLASGRAAPLPAPPPDPDLAAASRVQMLVTGSLHLVGATMSVLGCKVEDL